MANEYAGLAELKSFVSISDAGDDTVLTLALESAARMIDEYCGRRFYLDGSATARFFTPQSIWYVDVDDIGDTSGLIVQTDESDDGVFENTLASGTDFNLWPYNAAVAPQPMPYSRLELRPTTSRRLPYWPKSVKVTAKWGWPAVPPDVKYANLVQAASLWKRKDAPFGIVGSPDLGVAIRRIARLDADVETLLAPLRKVGRIVGVA